MFGATVSRSAVTPRRRWDLHTTRGVRAAEIILSRSFRKVQEKDDAIGYVLVLAESV